MARLIVKPMAKFTPKRKQSHLANSANKQASD